MKGVSRLTQSDRPVTVDVHGQGEAPLSRSAAEKRWLDRVFEALRGDLVRYLTRRTNSHALAADLTQDVYLKLGDTSADFASSQRARSYIFRMARNLAIDHQRVETRRDEILDGSHVLFEDVALSPEEIAISRDQLRQIERAMAELPPKVAEVMRLSRMQELTHKEIAAQMGISISLVEKYQLRALTHCRARLRDTY